MSSVAPELNTVDEETQLIVFGYIRLHQKLLLPTKYNIFKEIPSSIISICIFYYYIYEEFEIAGKDILTSNDKLTIIKQKDNWNNTTYGKMTIKSTDKCICKWKIKINDTGIALGHDSKESSIRA